MKEEILNLSYTDFVGFINQWNVLPGAHVTLSKWVTFGKVDNSSHILELACTSGFSSREIATITGCTGIGIDISGPSVKAAILNKEIYAPDIKIMYEVADGHVYKPKEKFTHVVVGAALKFFGNQKEVTDRIVSEYLKDGGFLLASPFFAVKKVPQEVIDKAREVFGITITTESYKEAMKAYSDFEIIYEDRCELVEETEEELEAYCTATIARAADFHGIVDDEVKQVMYSRLLEIRRMTNVLRRYQNYTVLVLRYRKNVYPSRYVELF
jgi:SAM-dependent methyltransferase